MGLKGYKLSLSKQGEMVSVIELNQTKYELTGLESNATYDVTIIAVDNFGNESEVSETCTFTTREQDVVPEQKLTVCVEATEGGTVTGAAEVVKGASVTVCATVNAGYEFDGWYNALDEKVSDSLEYTFTVEENTALVAKFVLVNMGPAGVGAEVLGYTLSLEGNIGVNFYLKLSEEVIKDTGAYMNFSLNGKDHSKVYVKDAELTTVNDTECYAFKCNVPVKDMDTDIKAQIVLSDGSKGSEHSYTIEKYADYILNGNYNEKTKELVEAMSDFGDYASIYFENGIKDEVSEEMLAVTEETLETFKATLSVSDIYYGSSLLLKSETVLRHYFSEKVQVVKVQVGDKIVEGEEAYKVVEKGNLYYVEYTGIPAHKLGEDITITVNTTAGEFTITYNPLSYAYIALSRDDVSENLRNLMRAMYLYYDVAQKYPR